MQSAWSAVMMSLFRPNVCQVTSPSWAPLFPLAAAVATAAREHGLPAVLGTGSATVDLQDGQAISVDGTKGLVLTAHS